RPRSRALVRPGGRTPSSRCVLGTWSSSGSETDCPERTPTCSASFVVFVVWEGRCLGFACPFMKGVASPSWVGASGDGRGCGFAVRGPHPAQPRPHLVGMRADPFVGDLFGRNLLLAQSVDPIRCGVAVDPDL